MKSIKNNKRAYFDFTIIKEYVSGMVLFGSEIKSMRKSDVSMVGAFCYIKDNEIFVKNLNIAHYEQASYLNHDEKRDKKLLLHRTEIKHLSKELINKSYTIVPIELYINDRGIAKLKIGLCKPKKNYDKRNNLKLKDLDRKSKNVE